MKLELKFSKYLILFLLFMFFSFISGIAGAQSAGAIAKISHVRALAIGSIHIQTLDTLGANDVCSQRLIASNNKAHNEKIAKVALAALLADKKVKVQFDTNTCQIIWLELRAN